MSLIHVKTSYPEIATRPDLISDILKIHPELINELEYLHNQPDELIIYLASFNGRVIALLSLTIKPLFRSLLITHLIVRQSTLRRGVGLFLLHNSIIAFTDEYEAYKNFNWTIFLMTKTLLSASNSTLPLQEQVKAYEALISALKAEFQSLATLNISVISE